MNWHPAVALAAIFTLLISACKKEESSSDLNTPMHAGHYDSTSIYQSFQPPVSITIQWDSMNLYGSGLDSVDIDFNGVTDLMFSIDLFNFDSAQILGTSAHPNPIPYPLPNCILTGTNNFEFCIYSETYGTGLGGTSQVSYVKKLTLGDRIDMENQWGTTEMIWKHLPNSLFTPPASEWYNASNSDYIGLKLESRYGWIEIDASDLENLKIKSLAFQIN
ncbi:MAG: hypothetical protein H6602_06765 [Flavobacteriales bacterium]|nr:hypothetical protein [Flavobacteriales bacterium]